MRLSAIWLKKLVKDGLVINHAYKGIELTEKGWGGWDDG